MLFNPFVHIPGIGETTERRIWQAGVETWDDFREPYPEFLSGQKVKLIESHLARSRAQVGQQAGHEFLRQLPAAWRSPGDGRATNFFGSCRRPSVARSSRCTAIPWPISTSRPRG